jgi:sialidase-1
MTLKMSYDEGKTWEKSLILFSGPAAYSDLVKLPDGSIGCLFEAGNKNPYEGIVYRVINLNEIE